MCYCCNLLNEPGLPNPKTLAKAWVESSKTEPLEHDEVILNKVLKKLNDAGLDERQAVEYIEKCQEVVIEDAYQREAESKLH